MSCCQRNSIIVRRSFASQGASAVFGPQQSCANERVSAQGLRSTREAPTLVCLFTAISRIASAKGKKADSTLRSSQAVPHPSTSRALRRLTSEVERDPVYSTRYGRQRLTCCAKQRLMKKPRIRLVKMIPPGLTPLAALNSLRTRSDLCKKTTCKKTRHSIFSTCVCASLRKGQ